MGKRTLRTGEKTQYNGNDWVAWVLFGLCAAVVAGLLASSGQLLSQHHQQRDLAEARTVLSVSPVLEVWDGFLSPEEVKEASALQFTRGEMNDTRNTRVITYYDALDVSDVPLLSEIDRRVAKWTGLPIVDHTGMQAKYQVGQPMDASNTGGEQVHLDNNNNPFRYATAILYLSDVPESSRGATVFPCLLHPLADGATMTQRAAHRRESAKRAKLCKKATKEVQATRGWALSQRKEDDPHGLWAMSARICNGTLDGVSVQPKSGRAVMFKTGQFEVSPDGQPRPGTVDPMLWHTACELLEGATKRIIIKFQEVGPDTRTALMQSNIGVSVPELMRKSFSVFDADGDDRLTESELGDLLASISGGRDPATVMRSCDGDGDGQVSLVEYVVNRMWFWPRAGVNNEAG